MRPRSKISPSPIFGAFLNTVAGTNGKVTWRDRAELYGIPLLVGVVAGYLNAPISSTVGAGLLTLAGLFSAFLFQLTIQLLERAAAWNDSDPIPSSETSEHARLLGDLSGNAAYAALVSAASAAAALGCSITKTGVAERVTVVVTAILLSHLVATLFLVTRRVFLLTQERLNDARTGATTTRKPSPDARRSA